MVRDNTFHDEDSPDEIKPLASAWAMFPAPMKPILRAAMLGVLMGSWAWHSLHTVLGDR